VCGHQFDGKRDAAMPVRSGADVKSGKAHFQRKSFQFCLTNLMLQGATGPSPHGATAIVSLLLSWERRILAHHRQGFPGALVTERLVALPPVWLEEDMSEADEYRQFAHDCIVWARIASCDDHREQFLELAKQWMSDAKSIDQAAKASEMAGQQIDRLGDSLATHEERQRRKRRLINGPREFRDIRNRAKISRWPRMTPQLG
jgi:hypothetical protein